MTATAAKYLPRYYSEVEAEAGSPDDCVICSGLQLFDAVTLGEGVTRDDGTLMDTIRLRELRDEAGLKPDGPLRLNDLAKYLRFLSEKVGILPAFDLDYYPGHPGGTLRMTWEQFRTGIKTGGVGILLGNPIGVKDPASPLRTVQNSDDYGHAIAVMDGKEDDARVFNALRRRQPGYNGERVTWTDLRQYTEAKKAGDRLYGSPTAIACAFHLVGSETKAARVDRAATVVIRRKDRTIENQKASIGQLQAATVVMANRITELESQAPAPPDCSAAVAQATADLTVQVGQLTDDVATLTAERDAALAEVARFQPIDEPVYRRVEAA